MPNKDTRSTSTFDYADDYGQPRTARATESNVAFPGQHDSQWEIYHSEIDKWIGPEDWLGYMPPDGVPAHIKFHMESFAGSWGMNVWFENERIGGEHNENRSSLLIYDWDGSVWKVSIPSEVRTNPWTPTFDLERK